MPKRTSKTVGLQRPSNGNLPGPCRTSQYPRTFHGMTARKQVLARHSKQSSEERTSKLKFVPKQNARSSIVVDI